MSDIVNLKTSLETASTELTERESALNEIIAGVKAQKKNPDENGTVTLFKKMVDQSKAIVEKITAQIASSERVERTKTIVEPLIAAFGTVVVFDAQEFKVEFVDIGATRAKLVTMQNGLTSKISALDALISATNALGISEETAADLKAVRFVAVNPTSYSLEMARSAGASSGTRGGQRASSSSQIFTITAAGNEDHANLVGLKIGKGQDFETWRSLVENTDVALFAKLEDKRLGKTDPTKKSNWSGAVVAERFFGIKYDSATATPTI